MANIHSIKTLGIVLKGSNFGEADKILTIFTERLGKVKVIAKGVRKIKSHLAGALEPFQLVNLQLHEGKTFYTVTGAVIKEEFPGISSDLSKTAKAFFIGELVDRFVEENEKSEGIFGLFAETLREVSKCLPGPLIQAFELKIIKLAGFKPELNSCLHCKEKITPGNNFWDREEGGIICGNCQRKFHHGHLISDETIKALRFFEQQKFSEISRLRISGQFCEIEKVLDEYVQGILERELKSKSFLDMV